MDDDFSKDIAAAQREADELLNLAGAQQRPTAVGAGQNAAAKKKAPPRPSHATDSDSSGDDESVEGSSARDEDFEPIPDELNVFIREAEIAEREQNSVVPSTSSPNPHEVVAAGAKSSGDGAYLINRSKEELAEALAAERLLTVALRQENLILRAELASLRAQLINMTPAATNPSPPSANACVVGSLPASSASATNRAKTMASLFGGKKTVASAQNIQTSDGLPSSNKPSTNTLTACTNGASSSPPSSSSAATAEMTSAATRDHDRRKAELLRRLAEDDEASASHTQRDDAFTAAARKKHIVIDPKFQGLSAVGFGGGPNPRGYFDSLGSSGGGGGGGGVGSGFVRGPTTSMEGDAAEVSDAMRRAMEDGFMDDRRAVLEAEEDAKLAARLKRLQERK